MNEFTIYCTKEQTKKALELGAPIETKGIYPPITNINGVIYFVPTAEQMIGWLEEQELRFQVYRHVMTWSYMVGYEELDDIKWEDGLDSRTEATLAAIDAALDYLISTKQQ